MNPAFDRNPAQSFDAIQQAGWLWNAADCTRVRTGPLSQLVRTVLPDGRTGFYLEGEREHDGRVYELAAEVVETRNERAGKIKVVIHRMGGRYRNGFTRVIARSPAMGLLQSALVLFHNRDRLHPVTGKPSRRLQLELKLGPGLSCSAWGSWT